MSKSSSSSRASQQTGGTQSGSSGQAVGSRNTVNTGTLTTVNTNTRNSNNKTTNVGTGNKIGDGNVITYQTGISGEDVMALFESVGNLFSSAVPSASTGTGAAVNGAGGVTVISPSPVSTAQTLAWADVAKKYAVWIVVAIVAGGIWLVSRRKKKKA